MAEDGTETPASPHTSWLSSTRMRDLRCDLRGDTQRQESRLAWLSGSHEWPPVEIRSLLQKNDRQRRPRSFLQMNTIYIAEYELKCSRISWAILEGVLLETG